MAEPHDDEREASRAYRELPREEPPARLDEAIRAAARREAQTRPAPLVAPTGRRRWYFPAAAAAVIVLAVAVTSQVEREQAEPAPSAALESKTQAQKETPRMQEAPRAPAERRPSREGFSRDRLSREEAARPQAAPAPPAVTMEAQAPQAAARANGAPMKQTSQGAELERIAGLRREGKDEEADRALAEFRKRYPEYRIAPEMLEKVEKKK